jgi:hypothetical protein
MAMILGESEIGKWAEKRREKLAFTPFLNCTSKIVYI